MDMDEDMVYRQNPSGGYGPPAAAYPPNQNNYPIGREPREQPPRAPVSYDRHGQPIAATYPPEPNYYVGPMNPGQGMSARAPQPGYDAVPRTGPAVQGGRTPPQARAPQAAYGQQYPQGNAASGVPVSAGYYEPEPPRRVDRHHPRR